VREPFDLFYRPDVTLEPSRIIRRRVPGLVLDGLLALLVGVVIVLTSNLYELRHPFADALVLCSLAALLARRTWPRMVLVVVTMTTACYVALGYPGLGIIIAPSLAMYTVAQRVPWWRALAVGGLSFLVVLPPYLLRARNGHTLEVFGALPLVGMALLLPTVLAVALRLGRESAARARAEAIRSRVEDERLQIAREVHDAIGHALAVIYMQAGVALHVIERRPGQVKEALEAVNQVSGEAMVELDTTFGVWREDETSTDGRGLGFERLESLMAMVRRAGLDVDLRVSGPRGALPAGVEMAAYRIIQESLTNALHHAGPVRTVVEIGYEPKELLLSIANEPGGPANAGVGGGQAPECGGRGIPGMRERAVSLGGTLEAHPLEDGGFLVRARLPR
jgi:signal transduction histidine kinase